MQSEGATQAVRDLVARMRIGLPVDDAFHATRPMPAQIKRLHRLARADQNRAERALAPPVTGKAGAVRTRGTSVLGDADRSAPRHVPEPVRTR